MQRQPHTAFIIDLGKVKPIVLIKGLESRLLSNNLVVALLCTEGLLTIGGFFDCHISDRLLDLPQFEP